MRAAVRVSLAAYVQLKRLRSRSRALHFRAPLLLIIITCTFSQDSLHAIKDIRACVCVAASIGAKALTALSDWSRSADTLREYYFVPGK